MRFMVSNWSAYDSTGTLRTTNFAYSSHVHTFLELKMFALRLAERINDLSIHWNTLVAVLYNINTAISVSIVWVNGPCVHNYFFVHGVLFMYVFTFIIIIIKWHRADWKRVQSDNKYTDNIISLIFSVHYRWNENKINVNIVFIIQCRSIH